MMNIKIKQLGILFGSVVTLISSVLAVADDLKHSDNVRIIQHDNSVFLADPDYSALPYDEKKQIEIYGGKQAYETPRPLIEWGGLMYSTGLFDESSYIFGKRNPTVNQFLVYGDVRTFVSSIDNPIDNKIQAAIQLNLDLDWQITATERFHVLVSPLTDNGKLTRIEFNEDINGDRKSESFSETSLDPDAFFFEGDFASITSGFSDDYVSWDLPFSFGLMPLIYQNGIWLDDAFTGAAFAIPAMNSPNLNISNMDISFFAGVDKVSSTIGGKKEEAEVYGIATFIEANQGYWELGYAFTEDKSDLGDQSYSNVTAAFSKRYWGKISNSVRIIGNFGQERKNNAELTADGFVILIENSLISSSPSTFIPYFNFFAGVDKPQSVARGSGAGGILKNTGITFDAGLAGLPTMDSSANDTFGLALGVENLFALNQQLVIELAALSPKGDKGDQLVDGPQLGLGVRYQKPLNRAWIFRVDANVINNSEVAPGLNETLVGFATEIRRKF